MRRPRRLPAGSVRGDESTEGAEPQDMECEWQAQETPLSEARDLTSRWLYVHRIPEMESVLHLAITELLTNAREASNPVDTVTLRLKFDDDTVDVEVENKGDDFEPCFDLPDEMACQGRGLGLVSAMADVVDVDHSRGRTRVVARFRL